MDFVVEWAEFTGLSQRRLVAWIGLNGSKYWDWKQRYGKANEHNGRIPRDHWLEDWEKARIIAYAKAHPLDGYRRLTFMMLDEDVVAVSPSSVYRVLKAAGLMERWSKAPSAKGTGFKQPLQPHECLVPAIWPTSIPAPAPGSEARIRDSRVSHSPAPTTAIALVGHHHQRCPNPLNDPDEPAGTPRSAVSQPALAHPPRRLPGPYSGWACSTRFIVPPSTVSRPCTAA
ncbi:MAG: hypothetical protein H6741_24400 [Alphaproteobacteria bacterium]|nr:hypothetical protein [Alphaproteobacteria bacterium]